ncbi:MAG: hypothetical protein PG981_001107 [Wolbachia endosymbiont of Ctenocephalides orientis wCori]|nr:MAG: hypothetical protein PG981_001107 [Wolbachia endosymbiont of Ctenocephalides orientis wCori]
MPTEHIISQEEKNKELLAAAETGDFERVKKAIELGVDVNAKNKDGEAALIIAAEKNHWKLLDIF